MSLFSLLKPWAHRETPPAVAETFPLFACNSGGSAEQLDALTVEAVNRVFPALVELGRRLDLRTAMATDLPSLQLSKEEERAAALLGERFDFYGSDKASRHGYHLVYGKLLGNAQEVHAILEIGIGTNDPRLVSNMGPQGKPGASLRAFRDVFPQAQVHGADIDRRIIFTEDRIATHWVDQTDSASLAALAKHLPGHFDLLIDDGLHSPHANVNTLAFGLPLVRTGGWVVIEDIPPAAAALWELVAALLPQHFAAHLITCRIGFVFAVQKLC